MADSCALILLAAGGATRMGRPKQLLDFGGIPLIRHAAIEALAAGCSPVIVVCGAMVEGIREALRGLDVELARNPDWPLGMGSSIQAGLRALGDRSTAAILALADQPLVTNEFYRRLIVEHSESARPIVAACYADTAGVPVLFARSEFASLAALQPSQGCKGLILADLNRTHLISCPEAADDLDTPEDYERIVQKAEQRAHATAKSSIA